MDFNNLFTLLNQGQCDMVIAAAEIDEEGVRPAAADYSDGTTPISPPKSLSERAMKEIIPPWRTSLVKLWALRPQPPRKQSSPST